MRLDRDPQIEEFRAEVRRFIEANRPSVQTVRKAGVRAPEPDDIPALRKWTAQLFEAGYYGGVKMRDDADVATGGEGRHLLRGDGRCGRRR